MAQDRRPLVVGGRIVPGPPVGGRGGAPPVSAPQGGRGGGPGGAMGQSGPPTPSFDEWLVGLYQQADEGLTSLRDRVQAAAQLGVGLAKAKFDRDMQTVQQVAEGTRDLAQRAYQGASEFAQQAGDELRQLTPEAAVSSLDALGSGFTGGERATPDRGSRLEQLGMGLGIVGGILDPSPGGEARVVSKITKKRANDLFKKLSRSHPDDLARAVEELDLDSRGYSALVGDRIEVSDVDRSYGRERVLRGDTESVIRAIVDNMPVSKEMTSDPDGLNAALQRLRQEIISELGPSPSGEAKRAGEIISEEVLPKITKARHGGTVRAGQYVGAPRGVDTPQAVSAMVKNYLNAMLEGVQGRAWYREVSDDLLSRSAGDTKVADQMADNLAVLSPANSVGGNANMSRNAHVQAMTGDPITAARFKNEQIPKLEQVYNEMRNYIGLKRDPFSRQMSVAWAPERVGRGVNDMHEARVMGYPENQTVSEANHAFMDRIRAAAIRIANERKLGGFDDWDTGSSQAAAWVGSKIRQGQIDPGDAGKSFATYFPRFEGSATYESTPGAATGHLPGLLDATPEARRAFDDQARWDTEFGNDALYAAQGLMPGPTTRTVGRYKDELNPVNVARPLAGTQMADTQLAEGSRRAMNATESFRSFFDAQEMGAWNTGRLLKGSQDKSTGLVLDIPSGLDQATMKTVADALEPKGYWLANDKDGGIVVLGRNPAGDPSSEPNTLMGKAMVAEVRAALKAAGVDIKGNLTAHPVEKGSIYYGSAWQDRGGEVTRQMLDAVAQSPTTMAAFEKDARIPLLLFAKNERDAAWAVNYGVTRPDILKAREIFAKARPGERFQALADAAKRGIVPAFLVGALVHESQKGQ